MYKNILYTPKNVKNKVVQARDGILILCNMKKDNTIVHGSKYVTLLEDIYIINNREYVLSLIHI